MDKFDIPAFRFKTIPQNEVRTEWIRYKRQFEYLALANGVTNKTRLKNIFLARAGPDVQDVFVSIPGADVTERIGVDPFQVLIGKLDDYFAPKQHDAYQRFLFWSLKPKDQDETLEKFMLKAMDLANRCQFGNNNQESRDISVIDKIIQLAPPELREKLLQRDNLTLDDVTRIVNSHQSIKFQSKQISSSINPLPPAIVEVNKIWNRNQHTGDCSKCGRKGHITPGEFCPARHKACNLCRKVGHFAKCCRSTKPWLKRQRDQPLEYERKRMKFEHIRNVDVDQVNEGKISDFIFKVGDGDEFLWVSIGGVLLQVLIDSGSEKNIIDDVTWEKMQRQGVQFFNSRTHTGQNFKAYGNTSKPLVVREVFDTTIVVEDLHKSIEKEATFYVVEGGSQPLLGRTTAKELGVLILGLPSTLRSDVFNVRAEEKRPFPKIKGIKLKIPIDRSVTPVCQHARRPPLALMDKIEQKLDSLLAADIIEPVHEYSEWVSPLVTIVKDNGDLRLCVDMRRANVAIKREAHPMPTFEDFLPRLKKAKVFSRLDIRESFYQLELHEESRHITTFITHKGMYRYKRLMFGISCAPEMFQKAMEQILADCENVVSYIDDILIFGEDDAEHDRALQKVMTVLKSTGVLLNHDKCVFKVPDVIFLGHKLSVEGFRPTEDKTAALKAFRSPQSAEELRSFLGLVTYVGRFLPNLATVTAPLRNLICGGIPFEWNNEHEMTFLQLKTMISNIKVLKFFDCSLRTRVIADASPVGLGAVLVQFKSTSDDSNPQVISFASKSLSPTEKRYCQTEKEALALVWAVERFATYLIGRRFELETDHKPLEAIFGPSSRPCARIERWVLRLQAFTFKVVYRKGSSNVADPLSRLSVSEAGQDFDRDSPFLVLAVLESVAIDTSELERVSKEDPELNVVRECVRSGIWDNLQAKPFELFKNEMGFVGDILVRGSKPVVPKALRGRMLELAHEGHPGETVMKRRLRDRVWWPGIDREVVKYIVTCEGCRFVSLPDKPEPMKRRLLPSGPWIDVAIDFLGPLPSGEYLLVIIDYYSRYKEIEVMRHITAQETTERLHRIFTRLGFPVTITLDNARQFASTWFDSYCKAHGIHLNYSTPYWPQENGLVERQNRSLLKRLQISHALGRNWKEDLTDYLMMYYTTPHSVTGRTPTELCYGRTIRSKIPCLRDIESAPVEEEVRERDMRLKLQGKEREDSKRRAKDSDLKVGDRVLMRNLLPGNKLSPNFIPNEYNVVDKAGARVTIRDEESGKSYQRNSAHLKRVTSRDQPLTRASESSAYAGPIVEHTVEPSPSTLTSSSDHDVVTSRARRTVNRPTRFQDYVSR